MLFTATLAYWSIASTVQTVYRCQMERTVVAQAVEDGVTLELVDHGGLLEVLQDGRLVMASDRRHSDSALAELGLGPWQGRDDISVLLAGLGMGFALRSTLDRPGVVRVDVVESSPTIVDWAKRYFGKLNGDAISDPRVQVHTAELGAFLSAHRSAELPADGWFAVLMDTDEWPAWTSHASNRSFYDPEGLRLLESALRGGGVLAMWTSEKDDGLLQRLHGRLQSVTRIGVASDFGLEYVYRGRRGPRRAS